MAFPVVESFTTSQEDGGNTTSHTVDMPSGVVTGDLLVIVFATDGDNVSSATGWVNEINRNNSTDVHVSVLSRTSDGTEGSSVEISTTSNERSSHVTYRISGHGGMAAGDWGSRAVSIDDPSPVTISPDADPTAKDYLFIQCIGLDRDKTIDGITITNYINFHKYQSH